MIKYAVGGYNYLLFVFLIVSAHPFALSALLFNALYPGSKMHHKELFQAMAVFLFRLYFFLSPSIRRLHVSGQEYIPSLPSIVTPSHNSWIDYLIISSLVPRYAQFTKTC